MTFEVSRRRLVGLVGLGSLSLLSGACGGDSSGRGAEPGTEPRASSEGPPPSRVDASRVPPEQRAVMVYKDPSCGCCDGWVTHAEESGFSVTIEESDALDDVFIDQGVPVEAQSCHLIRSTSGAVFAGHVPVRFVLEYLADPPRGSRGLSVPGMPVGAPGMEMGDQFDSYEILLLAEDGSTRVFAKVEKASDQRV